MKRVEHFAYHTLPFLRRFATRVEGFNQRSLNLHDLRSVCERHGIELSELPMRELHGGAFEESGFKFIFLNSLLGYGERVVAGFHEVEHVFEHVGIGDGNVCQSKGATLRLSKQEKQAQMIGVIALLPLPIVYHLTVEDMMREFEVPRQLAQFRFRVFQEYRV